MVEMEQGRMKKEELETGVIPSVGKLRSCWAFEAKNPSGNFSRRKEEKRDDSGTKLAASALMNRRLPGQSIRDQKEKLTDNRLIPYYFATVFAWLLWAWESYKARTHLPPQPRL